MFYEPGNKKCEKLKDIWIKLAEKMDGILKIAAVNCKENGEICEEYLAINKNYPKILGFPANSNEKFR